MNYRELVYGVAVAEAVALPYQYTERGTFKCGGMVGFGTWQQLAGTWSQHTSCILATVDSLKVCGGHIYPDDMFLRLRWWLERGKYAIGNNVINCDDETRYALETGEPSLSGLNYEALPRLLPVMGADYKELEMLEVLHLTNICSPMELSANKLRMTVLYGFNEAINTFLSSVYDCLYTATDYRSAVLRAVNLGGDTCTTAALVGGLAGLKYGLEGIPSEWLDGLRGKEIIETVLG